MSATAQVTNLREPKHGYTPEEWEARLDLAGDDGQRHAHGGLDQGRELGPVGAIADGACAEDGHLLGTLRAGEVD